jgi:glutathione S-transferase
MIKILHHTLDPASRFIRLILSEYEIDFELEEASHFKRSANLIEIEPLAILPILLDEKSQPIIGALAILHHIEENYQSKTISLFPKDAPSRAEMWRLYELIMGKFNDEISRYIIEEKIGKREQKLGSPDPAALRAAKYNLSEHEKYFAYLFATRKWLAGNHLSLADFALGAHLSSLDYLGNIDWAKMGESKNWYARIKSRPAFRLMLNDKVVGMPASQSYADLDF